ncbi:xanthine dehydrogenase family protein subunit M [Actinomycetospora endophytica]|uniref:Xanthine dehydrogenase family protein subunit M n=1 Tax=Actinomycetospora endophytica TaxID=2291215 RepID=A0ABS8PAW8_9PSEU|nr:xanthine dehydrogenase family protein subunit M [Actinomycetospora endophytica]MCD2195178.1 xanthine dehydrogenase family protein subunit M [Actinomycetospora endophytica]
MQVPAQFEYFKATSVDDAIALLTRHGPESFLVAGGHSLLPMMKLRLAEPETLIDINGLDDLAVIAVESDRVRIGAMVRHSALLASPVIAEHFPILTDAERVIADPVVRNRGTVGGSLCQADPSEDLSAAFSAMRATAVIRGADGERQVPVREFHRGPYETAVEHEELLVAVEVPILAGSSSAYAKLERRAGDWAVAAAGAMLRLDGDTVAEVGIGLSAVGASHFVAPEAEDLLRGGPATDDAFVEAGRLAARHCSPSADQRGPVDYKRHLAGELTTRVLRRAARRSRGEEA